MLSLSQRVREATRFHLVSTYVARLSFSLVFHCMLWTSSTLGCRLPTCSDVSLALRLRRLAFKLALAIILIEGYRVKLGSLRTRIAAYRLTRFPD
jgi:hypothetical protein